MSRGSSRSSTASNDVDDHSHSSLDVLISNINCGIDDLYQRCEAEFDENMCQDAVSLLDRSGRDFKLLIERIDSQRKCRLNQSAGGGWEHTFAGGGGVSEGSFFNRSMGSGLISSSPITINNDRNIDAAYASYINPSLTRGLIGAVSSLDIGPLLRDKNTASVAEGLNDSGFNYNSYSSRDSDQSAVKVQTLTPPRNSTLRAAATPFQPATLAMPSFPVSVDSISSTIDCSMNILAPAADPFALASVVINSPAVISDIIPLDAIPPILDIKAGKRKVLAVIEKQSSMRQSQSKQQPQQLQLVRGTIPTSSSTITSLSSSSKSTSARSRANSVVCNVGIKNSGAFHGAHLSQAYVMGKRDVIDAPSYDLLNCSLSSSERKRNSDKGREEWEAAMEAEVSEASEHVWRQVENWIEAEAMAEEAAWDVLVLGHDNDNDDNDNEDEERYMGDEIDCLDGDMSGKLTDPDSDVDSAPAPTSGTTAMHFTGMEALLAGDGMFSSGEDLFSFVSQGLSASNSAISLSTATSAASSPTASNKIQGTRNNPSPRSGSPVSSSSCPVGVSRILHAKLSSPDRRRALSPSEAKKRQEARQQSAESTRDKNVAERRLKALQVSDRVKMRSMNERNRLALAEQALEDRLRDAEKRHEECIKIIRVRAGNENTKVSEVMFINNMNAEGIVDQLRQKLVEVEARVLAAAERRQDILTGITVRQRKRNSRKVQQMSELRLHLERQKMERWDKLQRRLEAVQTRRQARFLEMQRRSDAQELTRARLLLAALAAGKEKDDRSKDADACSSSSVNTSSAPPTIETSDTSSAQSLVSKIVKFKSQLISPSPATEMNMSIGNSSSSVDGLKLPTSSSESITPFITATGGTSSGKTKEKLASNQSTGISLPSTSYSRSRQLINSSSNLSTDAVTSKSSLNGTNNHPTLTSLSTSSSSRGNRKGGSHTNIPLLSRSPVNSSKLSPSVSILLGLSDQSFSSPTILSTSVSDGIIQTPSGPTANVQRSLQGEIYESGVDVSQQACSLSINTISQGQAFTLSPCVGEGDGDDNNTSIKRSPRAVKLFSSSTTTSTSSPAEQIVTHHVIDASRADELDSTPGSPAEMSTHDNGTADGIPTSKKKKKRCKKKGGGEAKDEEMILLDALLSAKEKLLHISEDTGNKHQREKSSSEVDVSVGKVINGTHSAEVRSEVTDIFHHSTRRPQLMKYVSLFMKSAKKKKSVNAALDQAVGIRSICYDDSTLKAERVLIALSHIYSLYLPTARRGDLSSKFDATKDAKCRTIDLSVPGDVSIHSLMTILCGDSDLSSLSSDSPAVDTETLSHDATATNKLLQQRTVLMSAVRAVLSRLESATGDQRKETGLFIKHGGIYLLRVLFGTEVGVMALGGSSCICSAEDVVKSGLLMQMSKAVCACSTTAIARHALFSTGLAIHLSDIIGGAASHLIDWLKSSWCYNNCSRSSRSCGSGGREFNFSTIWPEECQVLPLLLSALTRLLKHAANVSAIATSSVSITSSALQQESHDQMVGWVKYLFASGCVSAICKTVKALQPFLSSLSTEALPHILLCSLLEVIGGISECLRFCHKGEIALGSGVDGGSDSGRGREGFLDVISDNLSSRSLLPTAPTDIIQNEIFVNPPNCEISIVPSTFPSLITPSVIIDQKSTYALKRKDMISIIKDLHLVPVLAQMLHRFLVPTVDVSQNAVLNIKESTSATDSNRDNETSSLRIAPIYCITGLIAEALTGLALADSSLIQCLKPSTLSTTTTATAMTTVSVAPKSEFDNNSVLNLPEERTGRNEPSIHLPVSISTPKLAKNKHNESSIQNDTDADSGMNLSIERMMAESSRLLLESLMTLMDTPVNLSKEINKDGISLVTFPSTGPGAGVVTKIVRKTSVSTMAPTSSQLATSYTLKSSPINPSCHADHNISESKSMELLFRPLDADNSVRHLLSLIGLIYSQSFANIGTTEKNSDERLFVESMCEKKESPLVRTKGNDGVKATKGEIEMREEKEESRVHEGLLKALLCLPKRYYTEERFKMQLLPTLQSVYEGREDELRDRLLLITSQ